jgi:predicted MFS family arabinose efflux permease
MANERRSLWIIIVFLCLMGAFQLYRESFRFLAWGLNENIGRDNDTFFWWFILGSPGLCAIISSLIYAYLHAKKRTLTLWLMALQMFVILLLTYYPFALVTFNLLAWMILFSVVWRSRKVQIPEKELRDDLLDDLR